MLLVLLVNNYPLVCWLSPPPLFSLTPALLLSSSTAASAAASASTLSLRRLSSCRHVDASHHEVVALAGSFSASTLEEHNYPATTWIPQCQLPCDRSSYLSFFSHGTPKPLLVQSLKECKMGPFWASPKTHDSQRKHQHTQSKCECW